MFLLKKAVVLGTLEQRSYIPAGSHNAHCYKMPGSTYLNLNIIQGRTRLWLFPPRESNREVVSRCHSFVALAVVYCSTDLALLGRPYLSPTGNFCFVKRSTLLVTWSLGCLKFFPVFQSQRHLTQSLPFWMWNSNH